MGCNCKSGKKQVMNNLQSVDHINLARDVYENIILQRSIEDFTDLDKLEIFNTYKVLYPNAKYQPALDNAVDNIKHAVLNYKK
jgi:predicted nucleic acid-binding protein